VLHVLHISFPLITLIVIGEGWKLRSSSSRDFLHSAVTSVLGHSLLLSTLFSNTLSIRRCTQKFPDWPPGARTANGTAVLLGEVVSLFCEFCRHNPLCCFSTSNTKGKRIFRYRLSPETFGYTLVWSSFRRHSEVSETSWASMATTGNTVLELSACPVLYCLHCSVHNKPHCTKLQWHYGDVSRSFRTDSTTKYTLTTINARWEATQRVMAANVTRLAHKIATQLHLVAESCIICSSRSRRPVLKRLDTPSYQYVRQVICPLNSSTVFFSSNLRTNNIYLWFIAYLKSRDSSVGIALGYGLDDRG
jgi:hypothetical protein